MTTTRRFLTAIACGLLAIAAASQLRADEPDLPITGSPSFSGFASASGASCEGCTTTVFFNNAVFLTGTGIYAGIPFGTPATFNNFSFTGDGIGASLIAPVFPLWSFSSGGNSYSFDLLNLSDGHTDSGAMVVAGSGTLHATGFDPTPASIGITGSGNNFGYEFSIGIPEPGSAALVGFGLAISGAIAHFRRRRG